MGASEIFQLVVNIAYGAVALALVIGCVRWRFLSGSQRLLLVLVLVTGLVEGAAEIFWRQGSNNLALFHGFAIVEFGLLGLIYRARLANLIPKHWLTFIIVLFSGFAVLNTVLWQPITTFNTNATTVSSFLLIGFALTYFYKMLRDMAYTKPERNPWLWFNIGVLIYYSSSFLLFTFGNRLIAQDAEVASVVYTVHAFFHILQYLFYSLALWIRPLP